MCVKFPSEDLNLGSCPPHPTSIYTYKVTNAQDTNLLTTYLQKHWEGGHVALLY